MSSFPLVYLLIPFGLILLLAVLFFFFNVFHIKRYAIRSSATTLLVVIYFISFGLLVAVILGAVASVDWSQKFEPTDLLPTFDSSTRLE